MPKRLMLTDARTLKFESYPKRELEAHEVLFRTDYSGISTGTELQMFQGTAARFSSTWNSARRLLEPRAPQDDPYSTTLGYELVATVADTAPR